MNILNNSHTTPEELRISALAKSTVLVEIVIFLCIFVLYSCSEMLYGCLDVLPAPFLVFVLFPAFFAEVLVAALMVLSVAVVLYLFIAFLLDVLLWVTHELVLISDTSLMWYQQNIDRVFRPD